MLLGPHFFSSPSWVILHLFCKGTNGICMNVLDVEEQALIIVGTCLWGKGMKQQNFSEILRMKKTQWPGVRSKKIHM